MASIRISEISSNGFELFNDRESFLDELADNNILASIEGGLIGFWLDNLIILDRGATINRIYAYDTPLTIAGGRGNSINNNSVNGQSINAYSIGNYNTIAG